MLKELMLKSVVIAFACSISFAAYAMADSPRPVNVPAGDLVQGLESLAKQADVELVYQASQLSGLHTPGVSGNLTAHDAVTKLLEGTKVQLRIDQSTGAMLIEPPGQGGSGPSGASSGNPSDTATNSGKEGKKSSSDGLRVAQAAQGQASGPSSVDTETREEPAPKKKAVQLEEVVVTGSRLPATEKEGPQDVKIYTRQQIDQSGQTTVSDFLNTLPDVSISGTDPFGPTGVGSTSVQIHGLPVGTTLVLLNGRRVQTSGEAAGSGLSFFDLNAIPLGAVDRIEVVSEGSSAVYGADAIAGVVNVVLKRNFDGFEANAKYGFASGTHEWSTNLGWGKEWDKGSLSVIASYLTRSELTGSDRSLTANNDYTRFGGPDNRVVTCPRGNVFSLDGSNLPGVGAPFAAVPAGYTGTPTQQEFASTAGTLNKCSSSTFTSIIPAEQRTGFLAQGTYRITPSVELFTELLYSHTRQQYEFGLQEAFGQVGFQQYSVSASNPFNPFGEDVGVSEVFGGSPLEGTHTDDEFVRALAGARGNLFDNWHWEIAGWDSVDWASTTVTNFQDSTATQDAFNSTNPGTALNPFFDGPPASPPVLQSLASDVFEKATGQLVAVNAFVHGPLAQLRSGPIEVVLGGEYERNKLYEDIINFTAFLPPNFRTDFHRTNTSLFGEARVPIIANNSDPLARNTLAVTMAGRYDKYSDFGSKATPQLGAEWRPIDTLLIRGTYGKAFKAPALSELHTPDTIIPGQNVTDPLNGNRPEIISIVSGGNPNLKPETGESRTLGFVYSSKSIAGLQLAVTRWAIDETNSIQSLFAQEIVNNENIFPGYVVRAPGQNGQAGAITQVNTTFVNFGRIDVTGFDYQLVYTRPTTFGQWSPSISATEATRYSANFLPDSPASDRVSMASDDGNWAPRWKGIAALGWKLGPYTAHVDGRYVGHYQDYDNTREIGNVWLYDANFRYAVGEALGRGDRGVQGAYLEVGGVNLFNTLPQYSNYGGGSIGYDAAQADIRGRFLYMQLGTKW